MSKMKRGSSIEPGNAVRNLLDCEKGEGVDFTCTAFTTEVL
ncbi:MAG: hypothetical protein P1Q69_02530 [Candidatus Thorarchaeota archaeon]|nr:hypothetical protein [Candidatus Thorarchaeota archaeon]